MSRDILDEFEQGRRPTAYPTVPATVGLLVEDRASGFCGDVVKVDARAVTLRGRGGVAFNNVLLYGTVGLAYGKITNSLSTSNTVNNNSVTNPKKNATGLVWGGGIEQKIGKFSIGTLYTLTTLKNDKSLVRLGTPFVANPANPFIAQNAAGTDFQRSFSKFAFHSVRAVVSYRF